MYLLVVSDQLLDLLQGSILLIYLLRGFHELHGVVQLVLVFLSKGFYYHQFSLVIIAQQLLKCQIMLSQNFMNH